MFFKHALADRSIIVNDLDYEKLQMIISPELHGIIHMYNFSSWEDSASLVNKLNLYLMSQNQDTSSDERFYLLSSRIEEYGLAKRAGGFLVILAAINWVIFWACSNIVLYYKLQSNMDERTKNYVKLYFVGMEKREIMRIELCKNLIMFLLPCVISLPITLFYSYSVTKIYYQEKVAVICTVIMIMITTVLQLTGYYLYTRIGKNKIDAIR